MNKEKTYIVLCRDRDLSSGCDITMITAASFDDAIEIYNKNRFDDPIIQYMYDYGEFFEEDDPDEEAEANSEFAKAWLLTPEKLYSEYSDHGMSYRVYHDSENSYIDCEFVIFECSEKNYQLISCLDDNEPWILTNDECLDMVAEERKKLKTQDIDDIYGRMKSDVIRNERLVNIIDEMDPDRYAEYDSMNSFKQELSSFDIFRKMQLDMVMKGLRKLYPCMAFKYSQVGVLDIYVNGKDEGDEFSILYWADRMNIMLNMESVELYYNNDDISAENITKIALDLLKKQR